jgi:hypothetical protein
MTFFVVPDHHIEFLEKHPQYLADYLEGKQPNTKRGLFSRLFCSVNTPEIPPDWPKQVHDHSTEINHRQVEYLHYLLNGTESEIANAGCLFQTWFKPHATCCAVAIDDSNFAFKSAQVSELKSIMMSISDDVIFRRYQEKIDDDITDDDKEFVLNIFDDLNIICDESISKKQGIIWSAS